MSARIAPRSRALDRGAYLADLTAAGSAGLAVADLAEKYGTSKEQCLQVLATLRHAGQAASVWRGGSTPARYYASQHAPTDAGRPVNARTVMTAKKHAARLDPAAPAIVPPGVVVQVCPASRDFRFSADPAVAGRGVITRDWRERQLQETQR